MKNSYPISIWNLILKGNTLRHTKSAVGIVMNVGKDVRIN